MTKSPFEVVAHRGVHQDAPENSLKAFRLAVELGVDAIELDVRLTADAVPVVFHYFYLDEATIGSGTIFSYTLRELQAMRLKTSSGELTDEHIPTLSDVLDCFAGNIGLEIEVKGPEPESAGIISEILSGFRQAWDSFEVTSYEPALLQTLRCLCPGLPVDLLIPRSEPWMGADVVCYSALQRARLAGARAVHLHHSQLCQNTVDTLRQNGIEIHAWDANSLEALALISEFNLPRIDTDRPAQALAFRQAVYQASDRYST
jgi:glycerophosphoryl diester phosphodiesterase